MSAQLLEFPVSAVPAAPRLVLRRYGLGDMVRLCLIERLTRRSQIEHLRQLTRVDGLPAPISHRMWNGHVLRGADAICAASQWDAAAVDAWAHRPGPAAPALSAVPPIPPGLRASLAQRARALAAGGAA